MTSPLFKTEHLRLSEVLKKLAELASAEKARVTVGEALDVFGERAFGAGMVLFAFPNLIPLPPGSSAILALPLLFITWQLMLGYRVMWLPNWLNKKSINLLEIKTGLLKIASFLERIEFLLKPRLPWTQGVFIERMTGFACFVLTIIIFLPIPLMNMLPAASLVFFSLGIVEEDGYATLIGWIGFFLCFFMFFFFFNVIKFLFLAFFHAIF